MAKHEEHVWIYKEALQVQSASNLGAVVHALDRVVTFLQHEPGSDTRSVAENPAVKLFVAKLVEMASMGFADSEAYGDAYDKCKEMLVNAAAD